jgi:hypothetical protein
MILSAALQAQTVETSAAPLPSQISTAKKVFISNGEGVNKFKLWSGGLARPYNEFYAAIRSWGRYELVAAPGDSDLVLQISSKVKCCSSSEDPELNLVLLDPKTHIVLWTLSERVSVTGFQESRDRNFSKSNAKLVDDLKTLTTSAAAVAK